MRFCKRIKVFDEREKQRHSLPYIYGKCFNLGTCTKDFIRKIITQEENEKGNHRYKVKYLLFFAIGNDPLKTSQKMQWRVTNKRYLPLKKRAVPCGWQIVRVSNIFIRFWTREGVAFA